LNPFDVLHKVMWPSAVILARWIMSNRLLLSNKSIMELGSGCGLTGLVAAFAVCNSKVIQTDVSDVVLDNLQRNIELNDLLDRVCTAKLDFYQQIGEESEVGWIDGQDGTVHQTVDVILAADVICKDADAFALAHTLRRSLAASGKAFIVCATANHRFGVDKFHKYCTHVGLGIVSTPVEDIMNGQLLSGDGVQQGLEQTCGYVQGMKFLFLEVSK